jgi:P4 family phage/plasmid primase-like protien
MDINTKTQLFLALARKYGPPFELKLSPFGVAESIAGMNDSMMAAFFALENLVMYEPSEQTFFAYQTETGIWSPVTDDELMPGMERQIFRCGEGWLGLSTSRFRGRRLGSLVRLLRGHVLVRDAFALHPSVINTKNGVLFIERNGYTFTEHHPTYFCRRQIPVAFDPDATCPEFDALLHHALPGLDDQRILRLLVGQFLLGHNYTQRILILYGPGQTGKSTLLNIIQQLVGEKNCRELRIEHLNSRFETHNYLDRSLLVGSDVPPDFLSGKWVRALKKFTGGDMIAAEKKGSADTREMRGNLNIVISANSRLPIRLAHDAGAWMRRIVPIAFTQPPAEKPDDQLAERIIQTEGAGVLNWALAGVEDLMDCLARKIGLPLSPSQHARISDLLAESDSLTAFVARLLRRPDRTETSDALLTGYREFCWKRGWTPSPAAVKEMRSTVERIHGIGQSHDIPEGNSYRRGYRGLCIPQDLS